jgi:hypothetical protein
MRAVVLDNVGIARAVLNSLAVVNRSLLAVILFVALTSVIQTGLGLLWGNLMRGVVGTLVAIVGNAFVGTGLLVAGFVFYRDRFAAWRDSITQANAGEGKA